MFIECRNVATNEYLSVNVGNVETIEIVENNSFKKFEDEVFVNITFTSRRNELLAVKSVNLHNIGVYLVDL